MLGSALVLLSLTAAVLLVPSVVALFVVERHRHLAPAEDRTRWARLVTSAVLVGLTALATAAVLDSGAGTSTLVAVVLAASVLVWAPLSGGWAVRGVVVWSLATAGAAAFLGWLLYLVVTSSLSSAERIVTGAAWLLLVIALVSVQGQLRRLVTAHAGVGVDPSPATPSLVRPALSLVALLAAGGVVATVGSQTAGPGREDADAGADRTASPEAVATPGVPTPVLTPAAGPESPTRSAAPGVTATTTALWTGTARSSVVGALAPPVAEVAPPVADATSPAAAGGSPTAGPAPARPTPRSTPTVGASPLAGGGAGPTPPGGTPTGHSPTAEPGGSGAGTPPAVTPTPSTPASASPTVLATRLHGTGKGVLEPPRPGAGPTPRGRAYGLLGSWPSTPVGPSVSAPLQAPPTWAPPTSVPPVTLPPVALTPADPGPPEHAQAKGLQPGPPPAASGGGLSRRR